MAKTGGDPIQDVKAFLARKIRPSRSAIAPQLREIYRRFDRVRRFQEGVGLSEALECLKDRGN
jgi:hypothetical protein